MRKIIISITVAIGVGFSVLFGASYALAFQPTMNPSFSNLNNQPIFGYPNSQMNPMISNSGQMMGGMNSDMVDSGSGMNQNMMNMMQMMSMMMPGMSGSGVSNMQSTPMSSIIALSEPTNTSGMPLDNSKAVSRVSNFLDVLNNSNLEIGVLSENNNNFYVAIQEKNTGVYAFDLLIDKMTGAVYAESGPNIAWNAKYGFMQFFGMGMNSNQFNMQPMMNSMGGMGTSNDNSMDISDSQSTMNMNSLNSMGFMMTKIAHIQVNPFATTMMTVTNNKVMQIAQKFLDTNSPNSSIKKIRMYYGYYTVDVSQDGKINSNLVVNGYTGQIWFKAWHNGITNKMMGR